MEKGTFTPLVFSTTGGMGDECNRFHKRLAELLSIKKGEKYADTISWIRSKVSFALICSALLDRGRQEELLIRRMWILI